jgi:hypothetical protein
MRLAHKISNDRLLTFSTGQAVHTGASEWVVAQSKERAMRVRPWVVGGGCLEAATAASISFTCGHGMCRYSFFLAVD